MENSTELPQEVKNKSIIWSNWWLSGKESAWQCWKRRFNPWVGKIPWKGKWQPTPVFLPAKYHGQRSMVGSSPWGHKRVFIKEQENTKSKSYMHPYAQCSISYNSHDMEKPKCLSMDKWLKKMCCIYTMEYCLVIKKNDHLWQHRWTL